MVLYGEAWGLVGLDTHLVLMSDFDDRDFTT